MPYISIESGRLTAEQKKELIERLTATASLKKSRDLHILLESVGMISETTNSVEHSIILSSDP